MANNLVLHTNSNYFNPDVSNLIQLNIDNELADLSTQISLLEENEQKFYSLIFPVDPPKSFNAFLDRIRDSVLPQDKKVFERFSNFQSLGYNAKESAQAAMQMSDSLKQQLGLKEDQIVSAESLRESLNFATDQFKDISMVIKLKQGTVNPVIQALKSLGVETKEAQLVTSFSLNQFFEKDYVNGQEFIHAAGKALDEYYKEREKIINRTVAKVKGTENKKNIRALLNKSFAKTNLATVIRQFKNQIKAQIPNIENEDLFKLYWDFVFEERDQGDMFYSFDQTKKGDAQYIAEYQNYIRQIINDLCIGGSPKLQAAKEIILKRFLIKDFNSSFSYSNIPGLMGEFSGALLFQYLNNTGVNPKIAGQLRNKNKEQLRGDIQFNIRNSLLTEGERFYGNIQVKNWQEKSLEDTNLEVNLHPYHFLQQIIKASSEFPTEGIAELENIFANMSFNTNSFEKIDQEVEHPLSALLKKYMAFTLNLYGGKGLDTSPFWMVGSGIIVPGSEIVKSIDSVLKEQKKENIHVNFTTQGKDSDDSYKKISKESGSPEFTKYWKKVGRQELASWRYRRGGMLYRQDVLRNDNVVSIHTDFNMMVVLRDILTRLKGEGNKSNYNLLNVFR